MSGLMRGGWKRGSVSSSSACNEMRGQRRTKELPRQSPTLPLRPLTSGKANGSIALHVRERLTPGADMKEIVSTITSKGQVTIPVEVRRHLGLRRNDKLSFVI